MTNETIGVRYGVRVPAGEVGIEIEMEGHLPQSAPDGWLIKTDGSLRGGYEWVFNGPKSRANVRPALQNLRNFFAGAGARLTPSDRCGIHAHINMGNNTFAETMRFVVLYLTLEEVLVKFCGDERQGNLFCLRAMDASSMIPTLIDCQEAGNFDPIQNDMYRYASINCRALGRYGSLEFRAMRTPIEFVEPTHQWVQVLTRLKDSAIGDFNSTQDIVESVSRLGSQNFLQHVLQNLAPIVSTPTLDDSIQRGARLVQLVAYAQLEKALRRIPRVKKVRDEEVNDGLPAAHRDNWAFPPPPLPANDLAGALEQFRQFQNQPMQRAVERPPRQRPNDGRGRR